MIITLVRHAEVIEEYQGKYNGHIDIPLSKKGREDSIKLARELKDEKFDKIYCSDLLRARETLGAFNFDTEPIYSEKLREKSWGKHEGKSFEEIQSSGIDYKDFQQWITALDGEDINLYKQRIEKYFFDYILKQEDTNILIVTHAGVIKTLISMIQQISLDEAFSIRLPYASYVIFDSSKMKFIKL